MKLSPEQVQTIIDRLPTANSIREIARDMGLDTTSVRETAKPFITLMTATGALGDCSCGKPRFHLYGCSQSRSLRGDHGPNERQKMFIELMLDGMPLKHIARMFDIDPSMVRVAKKYLSPEQRQRLEIIKERNCAESRRKPKRPRSTTADLIAALVAGRSYRDITASLGFGNSTIQRTVRRLTTAQIEEREARLSERSRRTAGGWTPLCDPETGRFEARTFSEQQTSEWRIAA